MEGAIQPTATIHSLNPSVAFFHTWEKTQAVQCDLPGPGCSSPSLLPVPTLLLLSKSQPNVRSSEHSSPTLPRASQWFAAAKKSRPHSTTPHLYFDICFLACWPPALLGRKLREHSLRAWHILSNSVGKICEPKGHSA